MMLAAGDTLRQVRTCGRIAGLWPWERGAFKPSEDAARNFEKAGALLAAEIDRLARLETAAAAENVRTRQSSESRSAPIASGASLSRKRIAGIASASPAAAPSPARTRLSVRN